MLAGRSKRLGVPEKGGRPPLKVTLHGAGVLKSLGLRKSQTGKGGRVLAGLVY